MNPRIRIRNVDCDQQVLRFEVSNLQTDGLRCQTQTLRLENMLSMKPPDDFSDPLLIRGWFDRRARHVLSVVQSNVNSS